MKTVHYPHLSLPFRLVAAALLLLSVQLRAQVAFRVMEYNVENLFDCDHDSLKNDYEFLPDNPKGWTPERYREKLANISKVILAASNPQVPDLVGLCEVENSRCVTDLVKNSPLKDSAYEFAMTDSPDERGIDVVLLYQPSSFKHLATQSIRIPVEDPSRRPTRDILHVAGQVISGDTLDVFVCHLPSRSGGEAKSEPYRLQVAGVLRLAADSVMNCRQSPNVIIMGDFNDYPSNRSISKVLGAVKPGKKPQKRTLYNLMDGKSGGTYRYQGEWGTLDNFLVSGNLLKGNKKLKTSYDKAQILQFPFLLEEDDKYGGPTPFRTYWGKKYHGGFSDHLPVAVDFIIKN